MNAPLIARLAQALDASPNDMLGATQLEGTGVVRNRRILRRLRHVDELPLADQKALVRFLDALLVRHGGTISKPARPTSTARAARPAARTRPRSHNS